MTVVAVAAGLGLAGASVAFADTLKIVGLGDSLMAGYQLDRSEGFPAQLQALLVAKGHDVEIIDAGVSGDTTSGGLARVDWSVPDGTAGVILELGANDALRGIAPEKTRENLQAIIERLQARGISVFLAGMMAPPNMGADYEAKFNAIYPDLAKQYDIPLYPFFLDGVTTHPDLQLSDGMHPNAQGVKVMAEKILPMTEAFLSGLEKSAGGDK